jgi:hypothetical protein
MDSTTMPVVMVMAAALVSGALFKLMGLRSFRAIVSIEGPQALARNRTDCVARP